MVQVRRRTPVSTIEFRSVTKIYRAKRVIDSLSFMVQAGERIVLFGPSGCGKSTTLLLIAGLVAPDAGEIRLDGTIVSTAARIHVAPQSRGVGMVFQDLALWPHLSVAEKTGSDFVLSESQPRNVEGASTTSAILLGLAIICTCGQGNFPEESNSVSRWRELSLCSRGFCSWMNRSRILTQRSASGCGGRSCACKPNAASR